MKKTEVSEGQKKCTWCRGSGAYVVNGKKVVCKNPDSHGMQPRLAAAMAEA